VSKALVPVYSRDIIVETIRGHREAEPTPGDNTAEYLADLIIQALAKEHLHIFKAEGSELS
jgi:hypothetical protein